MAHKLNGEEIVERASEPEDTEMQFTQSEQQRDNRLRKQIDPEGLVGL